MSKSRKKYPISSSTTATSEKFDKKKTHKRLRQKEKLVLRKKEEVLPLMREISNIWNFAKDGKIYWDKKSSYYEKALRK